MSDEDAIFILSYIKNFRVQGKDAIDAIDIGINAIKQLPSVTQKSGKWIPVSERLPKPYEQVLRTVKSFGWNSDFHVHVDIDAICPIDTDVLAWMPLPEPYKAESEE